MKRKTTKELLVESFQELALEKRIDKITISEITNILSSNVKLIKTGIKALKLKRNNRT